MPNIVSVLQQNGKFTTLLAALDRAGLIDTLSGPGAFTLFAPTDDAFGKLPAGTLDSLLANTMLLRNTLTYHVISGELTTDDIKENDITSATTLQGERLLFDVGTLGITRVNDAAITRGDILTENGVIHIIDAVMVPGSIRGQMAA